MNSPDGWALAVFGMAGGITALTLPAWSLACRRMGLVDEPGHRKPQITSISLAGGWALLSGVIISLMFMVAGHRAGWCGEEIPGIGVLRLHEREIWVGLLGSVAMFAVGALDDRIELRAGQNPSRNSPWLALSPPEGRASPYLTPPC